MISCEKQTELTPKAAPDQSHNCLHRQHLKLTCFSSPLLLGQRTWFGEGKKYTLKENRATLNPILRASVPATWGHILHLTLRYEEILPHTQCQLYLQSHSYQGDTYQHTLRKDVTVIHFTPALLPKALDTPSLRREVLTFKKNHFKTVIGNCFS